MKKLSATLLVAFISFFTAAALSLLGDGSRVVDIDYTYSAPKSISVLEAERQAVAAAQIRALADEFGTVLIQQNLSTLSFAGGSDDESFHQMTTTDVRGEWVENVVDPKFSYEITPTEIIINVKMRGRVREVKTAPVPLEITVLRNGTEPRFASVDFADGDAVYMSFMTPVSGYVSVYMLDEASDQVYQCLPYLGMSPSAKRVLAGEPYVFFSKAHASDEEKAYVDDYQMSSDTPVSWSTFYVLFSEKDFNQPMTVEADGVKQIKGKDFRRWLSHAVRYNSDLTYRIATVKVRGQGADEL